MPFALDPGRLTHQVVIQGIGARTPDGGGGYATSYAEIANGTVWAEVRPLSGNERLRAMKTTANATHMVTIRYRNDVSAKNRILHDGRAFKIVAPPIDPDERHDWLQLLCSEEA